MRLADNLHYEPIPYVYNEGDECAPATYNENLCPSRGDQVTYVEGEDVTINVFNRKFNTLEIFRDGIMTQTVPIDSEDITIHDLASGTYNAHLRKGNSVTENIHFEIINEKTSVSRHGRDYLVSFGSSNGVPIYLVVCSRSGVRQKIVDIAQYDISVGGLLLQGDLSGMYLKVFYQGMYGQISKEPIRL